MTALRIGIFASFLFSSFLHASNLMNGMNALNDYNQAQFDREARPEQAILLFERALGLDPQLQFVSKDIYRHLGDINFRLERWEDAFKYYMRSLEQAENMSCYENLTMVCTALADAAAAQSNFAKAEEYNLLAKKYSEMASKKNN